MWVTNIIKTAYGGIGEENIWGKLGNILIPRVCLTERTAGGTLGTVLVGKWWKEGWLGRYALDRHLWDLLLRRLVYLKLSSIKPNICAVLAALNKLSPNRLDTDLGCNLSLIFNLETSTPGTLRIKVRRQALGSHVIQPISSLVWNVIHLFAPLPTGDKTLPPLAVRRPFGGWGEETDEISDYRKIPKISPSMYKPLQI